MIFKLISKLMLSVVRMVLCFGIVLSSWNFFVARGYNYVISQDTPIIKEYAKYLRPLKDNKGNTYCSSSSIIYNGKAVTLTNNHCCEFGLTEHGSGEVRVGDTIEKLLYRSKVHDVCVLTSSQKDTPIKLAKKDFDILDIALIMGYPRGTFLTPRFGHVVAKNEEVCIRENMYETHCARSHIISGITYPGNSGSPVFNSKGELVNLIYAGNVYVVTMGITVPLVYVRAALDAATNNN